MSTEESRFQLNGALMGFKDGSLEMVATDGHRLALIENGLVVQYLHEHDSVPWRAFDYLRCDPDGLWRWPDKPWLPLSFSLKAERR